ncbi:cytochrome P450 [Dentipellis sp. KUC8613]|nr:cytochrome P450 [Dentipellis sp. KUC8613]
MDRAPPSSEAFRSTHVWLLTLTFCAFCLVRYFQSPWRSLPPGPTVLHFLGKIFQLRQEPWEVFKQWGQVFGPVVYLNVLGQPLVIINSRKVAVDLLDRRAEKYSGRPRNIVASDILTGGLFFALAGYNTTWRRLHKAALEGLKKSAVTEYRPIQYNEALLLTSGMLSDPRNWDTHLYRTSASVTMSMVYNTPPIQSKNDPAVKSIADCVFRITRAVMPGAHLVEFFPWMMHLPKWLASWKAEAMGWFSHDSAMFERLFSAARDRWAAGVERASLATTLIEGSKYHGLSEREVAWLAATVYAAGADTTAATMAWWMLAMAAHPDAQRRAQEELDTVVGRSRPPSFADFEHLPYIQAMAKEVVRWQPIDRVGIPRRSLEDDWYNGYFIPAGSVIIVNMWHLCRNPEVYGEDAAQFNPSRHLDAHGQLASSSIVSKEGQVAFGFGSRICLGRHFANDSLFIGIAMILWALNIEPAVDEKGNELPLDLDGYINDGVVMYVVSHTFSDLHISYTSPHRRPVPFQCKITPRFADAVSVLEQERELSR